MIGVSKVGLEVDDLDRAKAFWTEAMGFELVQDTPYGDSRWLEVRTPDQGTVLILSPREHPRRDVDDRLPHGSAMFGCDDLHKTYEELTARGVEFAQPPVQLGFGWWSLFVDQDGNRHALVPRGQ